MTPFEKHAKTFNNICLVYEGFVAEYIVQLNYIIPLIHKKFPDLSVSLYVREDMRFLVDNPIDILDENQFGFIKHFKTDPAGEHPILNFIRGADLPFPAKTPNTNGKLCLICPNAMHPSKSLISQQIDQIIKLVTSNGYEPIIANRLTGINDVSWVIGAENEHVFLAGALGKRVTLIESGPGTELFKIMFANHGEVIKI